MRKETCNYRHSIHLGHLLLDAPYTLDVEGTLQNQSREFHLGIPFRAHVVRAFAYVFLLLDVPYQMDVQLILENSTWGYPVEHMLCVRECACFLYLMHHTQWM